METALMTHLVQDIAPVTLRSITPLTLIITEQVSHHDGLHVQRATSSILQMVNHAPTEIYLPALKPMPMESQTMTVKTPVDLQLAHSPQLLSLLAVLEEMGQVLRM